MTIKVINKADRECSIRYNNVISICDVFDENGNYCHQLQLPNNETATFPASEWEFRELGWIIKF